MIRLEKLHGFHLDLVNGHWFHLPSNYYKLNVDDSVRDGNSTHGGLLWNHAGEWMWGFIGWTTNSFASHTELLAIKEGLMVVHRKGILRVIIESDSSEVVNLINGFPDASHPLLLVIFDYKCIHKQMWSSFITYISRSYNSSEDCIAKLGHVVCTSFRTV